MKKRIALLIDAENTNCNEIDFILEKATAYGDLIIRRVYGDFTTTHLSCWGPIVQKHALVAAQKFPYKSGKNCTDIELIMDAVELKERKMIDGMVLVSGDSDYTGLILKFREHNLQTIVIGSKHTSDALKNCCCEFVPIPEKIRTTVIKHDIVNPVVRIATPKLRGPVVVGKIKLPEKDKSNESLIQKVKSAINEIKHKDGFALMSVVVDHLQKMDTGIKIKSYGYPTWRKFLQGHPAHFITEFRHDTTTIFVKIK
jgi:uncharacterized protein (TIGR00288 family)